MVDDAEAIRDRLARFLDDPASHWSLGGFGAGALFGHAPGEFVAPLGRFGRLTPRGALILDPTEDLVPVAYETGFSGGWSHAVALCLPVGTSRFHTSPGQHGSPLLEGEGQGEVCGLFGEVTHLTPTLSFQEREPHARRANTAKRSKRPLSGRVDPMAVAIGLAPGPEVVTLRGPDTRAARPEDRDALLFDLGIGLPQGWVGLRTRDPRLVDILSAACGAAAFAPGSPVADLLAGRRADVVVETPLGRSEVFGGSTPPVAGGPRAFVDPQVLRARRTHAATAPIPAGLVPCAHLHPPHPCRDAAWRPIPFDGARHAAFQALLRRWGDSSRVALKTRLVAGEALPPDADRAARAVARVVAAQAAARANTS